MNTKTLTGYLMVLASALCFGSYGVWSRILGPEFGIYFQGWVRAALILVILLPIAIATKALKPVQKEDRWWFGVCMAFTVFTQVPLYVAFNHLALGTASLIFYSVFLITSYVVGWLFLGEEMTGVKLTSLILALVGLVLTFGVSLQVFSVAALSLAALNGLASGGEVSTSKKSTVVYSSVQISVYSWVCILLTHLPLSLLTHERQLVPTASIGWFAMLGYATTGLLGFWLVIEGFRHIDASIGGLIGLLEIIFSLVFGILFFADHLTPSMICGGVIIIAAAMLPDLYNLVKGRKGTVVPISPS